MHAEQRLILFDVWAFSGHTYELTTYIVEDDTSTPRCHAIRGGIYYCVTLARLEQLMSMAGYTQIQTVHDRFFQPLLIGTKP